MFNPVATYRLQFHKDFTFNNLEEIISYLDELGVSTVYASPVFESVPGSTHGYDAVNPHHINPEIGTLKQLKSISHTLKKKGINWLQDIVPNHMAFHPNNSWLMDVLEKGSLSPYEAFFDLTRTSDLFKGRLMVPFLGTSVDEVIENGELKIAYEKNSMVFKYYDTAWPLHLRSYETILKSNPDKPNEAIQQLLNLIPQIHEVEEPKAYSLEIDEFKMQFASLIKDPGSKKYVNTCLQTVNKNTMLLAQIESQQVYRLCSWQETDEEINFRRFFTVNGLICLNMQNKDVFNHFHKLISFLLDKDIFQGLRIDHIDGLYDPSAYLRQLRDLAGKETYIVVEKILEPGEDLPSDWPIQGNTGYDFLSTVNNLFTRKSSEKAFSKFYTRLTHNDTPVHQQIEEKKAYILHQHMGGELENLFRLFYELNMVDKESLDSVEPGDLKEAIGEFLIHCPVYRYYGNHFPLAEEESKAVAQIFNDIRKNNEDLKPAVDLLEAALLQYPLQKDEEYQKQALQFYQRSMQFTGPLMAKGVEDTLMYTYNRFIDHNEVGDSPEFFGFSVKEFHQKMKIRQEKWPLSINATSTHDTKRGEDVRTRLNVLTELSDEWLKTFEEWHELNQHLKENDAPDLNDEYFIYQTLVGAYPMQGQDEDEFSTRIQEYLEKALREAKRHSDWANPNEDYEKAVKAFALGLLDKKSAFWKSFKNFHRKVADFGIVNSLAQVLLKFTCPGVPDIYQGCELWDLSMVDPDNRRPADYRLRQQILLNLTTERKGEEQERLIKELWADRYTARIKLWLVHTLLQLRKQETELFEQGDYIPLQTEGRYKDHVMAFARRYNRTWVVIAAPLGLTELCSRQKKELNKIDWKDTQIVLPQEAPLESEHIFLKDKLKVKKGISVTQIFKNIPIAVLKLVQPENERGAGLLMHISSLPSPFGIGDLGPEAKVFADFLSKSCQKYWQLLPLSPTELVNGHSPYSSYSSMAGNTLLLSPEMLVDEGLLSSADLKPHLSSLKNKVDFEHAEKAKNELFEKAWNNFNDGNYPSLKEQFDDFCINEAYWLNHFAVYVTLKAQHNGDPWHKWEEKYRLRDESSLTGFAEKNKPAIQKEKWLQFIFSVQWNELKAYCKKLNIRFIGDLPFYVSYDSVDVWSHPEFFSLDEDGNLKSVAGVPPDYFNANGQLWGMPVFNWTKLKEQNYAWWIQRIRKNMKLYDLLRLDHFRAFSSYWEIPANEETAINGVWVKGPGADFFNTLKKELGALPFIAEDLGDIDEAVYQLRDEFNLPGMKVLQFAFGDDMPGSDYIPHNYTPNSVVYTGTHDNNTTRGWYKQDADQQIRKQIEQYSGISVRKGNIYQVLSRMAYASVARISILPVQDVLGLSENARINTPASVESNWLWRLLPGRLHTSHEKLLREWTRLFNRA